MAVHGMVRYVIFLTLPIRLAHSAAGDSVPSARSHFLARSAATNTTTDAHDANISSQSVAPPMTNNPSGATPSFSCEQACFFKGEAHTCRERVNWLVGEGHIQLQAIGTVNSECQGQCSCSHGSLPNPTPRPP